MDIEKEKAGLTLDKVADWWRTEISDIAPGVIRVRGYPIEDLIGRVSFPAMIWLTLRGELPNKTQERLFGAVLVSGVDHGPQPPGIAIARMAATCGVGINGAMASGINALGDVHGGAGQQCMELIADIAARWDAGKELEAAVRDGVRAFQEKHGGFVSGFGHRFHPVDPRTVRLTQILQEALAESAITGRSLAIGRAIEAELARGRSRPPGMNIDGITAVVLSELGFPPELGRGVFILSRSVGICAHAYEQMQHKERVKGPMPPEAGYRYGGPKPRRLPEGGK